MLMQWMCINSFQPLACSCDAAWLQQQLFDAALQLPATYLLTKPARSVITPLSAQGSCAWRIALIVWDGANGRCAIGFM